MALLKIYKGTFQKRNGDLREMRFIKLDETPPQMLPKRKTDSGPKQYSHNVELVWDLEKKNFRIFNWDTVIGFVIESQEEINILE